MKVVLSPNPYRDRGLRAAQFARRVLERSGVEAVICLPFELDEGSRLELPADQPLGRLAQELEGADVLVCFGGDGTILHSAREATARNVPVMGVNLGSIGFMAELEHNELSLLSRLAGGRFGVERRMMLDVTVRREGRPVFTESALNDAVVTKGAIARVVEDIKNSVPAGEGGISYPGERTLATRRRNLERGIPVLDEVWERIQGLR